MAEVLGPQGKPLIKPAGRGAEQVGRSGVAETTGGVKRGIGPQAGVGKVAPTAAPPAAPAKPAAPPPPAPPISRPLTASDIAAHLLSLGLQNTDFMVRLSSLAARSGIELTRENLMKLVSMLEGTDHSISAQEAAIVLLSKGIDSSQALQILTQYFTDNPQMAQQMLALQEMLANLGVALGASRGQLDTNLIAALSALMSQFEELLQKLPGRYLFSNKANVPALNRKDMLNDIRALKSLLQGLQEGTLKGQTGAELLSSTIAGTMSKLNAMMQSLVARTLISQYAGKQDLGAINYAYWQIPNSLIQPPQTMELVIKRDNSEPNAPINPANTQIIMSLETPRLGKIGISITVKEKNIGFVFSTQREETRALIAEQATTLRQRMADHDFVTKKFRVQVHPMMSTVRPYLIPLLGLDELLRVDVKA